MAQDVSDNENVDIRLREDEEMDFFTELALHEVERWIQAVTRKKFQHPDDFRKSLGNGILLCELLNSIKPGAVKRINKLPGAIAGLDNINVFLRACATSFGLNPTQLFDPNDLEDLSQRAISDEDENLLKQEVDRRARNVAVTIYWLGRTVAGDSKLPSLDTSAFAAIVHVAGHRSSIIADDSFKNESWHQLNSPPKDTSPSHKHIRDSSYDSLGSYEPESESSFDDLDGSMPVRSDMKGEMKRYGSQGSLSRDLRLSATSDTQYSDKNDSMYQSSPDLSQGSHAHTRSSSTDSAEGGYYGNHSRQSSGSTETYPTRLAAGRDRKTSSTSGPDPMQFVKVKTAKDLAKNAEKQIEITKEVNKMRGVVESGGSLTEEPDWQSNFKNWKNKRRKSTPAFASVGEDEEEKEEKAEKQTKTFGQMMTDRNKRRSLGPMNFYPLEDDGLGFSGQASEPAMTQSNSNRTESQPKGKKSKQAGVAPWARDSSGEGDSQSDSETNNSHQSGDTDSVFSDKSTSTPSRVLSDDDSWVKSTKVNSLQSANKASPAPKQSNSDSWVKSTKVNSLQSANKASPAPKQARPLSDNFKRWDTSALDSHKKDEKKKVDMPKGTANMRNLKQAYEQKDKEASAEPVVMRRRQEFAKRSSFEGSGNKMDTTPPWKSLDLSNRSPYLTQEQPLSPTSPKALIPREQRYSWTPPKDAAPTNQDKHALSPTQRSRYLETSSPPKHSKTLTFGAVGDKPDKKAAPAAAAKPTRDRIQNAKAMFEKTAEEQRKKTVVVKRKLSERTEPNPAEDNKDKPDSSEKVQEITNDVHDDKDSDLSKKSETDDNAKDIGNETMGENRDTNQDKQELGNFQDSSELNAEEANTVNLEDIAASVKPGEIPECLEGNNGYVQNITESQNDLNDLSDMKSIEDNGEKALQNDITDKIEKSDAAELNNESPEINDLPEIKELLLFPTNQTKDILLPEFEKINETNRNMPDLVNTSEHVKDIGDSDETFQPMPAGSQGFKSDDRNGDAFTISCDQFDEENKTATPNRKKFTEKIIKISQKPNNERGFGFTLEGGIEKKRPITVLRVSLGSGADINELEMNDELVSVNSRDVSTMTLAQVQAIVDHSVKRGQIELIIKRYIDEEGEFDSGQEEEFSPQQASVNYNSNNNNSNRGGYYSYPEPDTTPVHRRASPSYPTSNSSPSYPGSDTTPRRASPSYPTSNSSPSYPGSDTTPRRASPSYQTSSSDTTPVHRRPSPAREQVPDYSKPVLEVSVNADNNRPSLMDQLVKEQQQQQQQQQRQNETNNNNSYKPIQDKDEETETQVIEQMVENFSFSSQGMPKVRGLLPPDTTDSTPRQQPAEVDMNGPPDQMVIEERPTLQMTPSSSKGSLPATEMVTEERSTINMTTPKMSVTPEQSPVPMPRRRTPERSTPGRAEAFKVEASPPPPTPPKAEPPPLATDIDDSGFGPPAALLRWQRPRVKSEYQSPFPSTSLDAQVKASKRLSATLPPGMKSPFSLDDYSKDDTSIGKVTLDSDLSKSNTSLRNTYNFDDSERIREWEQKQEQERKPDPMPVEVSIQREERLTAQHAEPSRRVGQFAAPDLSTINVPSTQPVPPSQQEKFERDQEKIRRQYEEEKRAAREAEKKKQDEDQKLLDTDKFLQSMEAQVIQTKQEVNTLNNMQPIRPPPTQPKFNPEPLTMRVPINSQGRQLVIDPRNQEEPRVGEAKPEYSFHVDNQVTKPPLRTLNREPEVSPEELLERERQKIREEEHRKLEEEKLRWQQEQEQKLQQQQESLRQQQQRLQQEEERIAREKAALEQQRHHDDHFTPHQHSPTSSTVFHPHKTLPSALDPKHREAKKAPPPTAPKPKARLTREDLLMMNRKPTPMTKLPEGMDENASKSESNASHREPPTKAELHSLNAVPKPKLHSSGNWIKEEDPVYEKPFVIGKRSDLIHTTDSSNPQDHWVVREAERRRKSEQNSHRDYDGVTARAGPTKPNQSTLINRFRGDVEPPPRPNRYSMSAIPSSDSRLSSTQSRPLSSSFDKSSDKNMLQFSAKTSPNSYSTPSLSQTLPTNFSFNANLAPSRDVAVTSTRVPGAPSGDSEPVIAVSGKQKCSHCGEELAGLKFSKV